jgi:excisionase family DNA binding protein
MIPAVTTKSVISAYLTSHAVAKLVRVSPSTVLSWIDKGLLPAHRTPGGHRRVEPAALVRFLREHDMPIPRDLSNVSRLLVIDDEAPFLSTARRFFKRYAPALKVETADGAIDGLLKVGTFRPDAVLLDAFMPGMDGVEVCRRLRASGATAHIRVVAITAHVSPELETAFRKAGAVACLSKPLDPTGLLAALGLEGAHEEIHT